MKRRIGAALCAVVFWSVANFPAAAGPIVQGQSIGARNLVNYAPIGQIFTAEDARVTIGFDVKNDTQVFPGGNTFRYDLLSGAGTSGPVVASVTFDLPDGFSGYADANFSSVNLTPGQQYTVMITAPDADWAVFWNQTMDEQGPIPGRLDYAGGSAIWSGAVMPNADLTFQVQPVPEPGSASLLCLAAGLAFVKGRDLRFRGRRG